MLGRFYPGQTCSTAGALEVIGERWSLLIIRDALFVGLTRFSEFERSLGIAPNILAKRLEGFLADGLMELRTSPGEPKQYVLTEKGRGLKAVIMALSDWGEQWVRASPVDFVHRGCNEKVSTNFACNACGDAVALDDIGARRRVSVNPGRD